MYCFQPRWKALAPFHIIHQYFFLLFKKPDIYISLFAGYHSWLPGKFAKRKNRQNLIILGGTDCVSFPSINYGNFNKRLLGKFTTKSLLLATHLAPVDESLVNTPYSYTENDPKEQGYQVYVPNVKAPHTTIHFGYNDEKFCLQGHKTEKSFLTVGYLNSANFYRKGIDLIIQLAGKLDDCSFTIIGGTQADIPTEITIPGNIKFIKSVTYDELVNHYSSHQFYLQLSMMEGFPSAICEAMLCECIPIGSNVGAIANIIGKSGYILEKRDFNALLQLSEKALSEVSDERGKKARAKIMQDYPPNERDKLLELTYQLINEEPTT